MISLLERRNIRQTRLLCRKDVTLEHIVGCCTGKYAQCSTCIMAELMQTVGQARDKVLDVIDVEQSGFTRRQTAMVRPRLTENWMHPAVLNGLDNRFNISKSLLGPTVR